ncbi:MAG: Bug family tripartite tricarboxylate transporter substrate binding protein [Lautropia sp.]
MNKSLSMLLVCACVSFGPIAAAQDGFPSRPVRMIVPYPPGGGGDILARSLAAVFQKATGQPMVIDNRVGANGIVGAAACKNAAADGYTYCIPYSDVMAINPYIYKKVPYSAEDFTVVAPIATSVLIFVANSQVPVNSLKELAAWSAANKQKANFATWGVGSAAHLAMEQFNKSMSGSLTNVPYQGGAQMLQSTLAGDASATLLFYGLLAAHINDGKLKPLAVLSSERTPALPDVPTVSEAGFSFSPTLYYGVYAPAGTPAAIVERMNQILTAAAADPAVLKTMGTQGYAPLKESAQAFGERVARDRATWGPIAKSLNLALD